MNMTKRFRNTSSEHSDITYNMEQKIKEIIEKYSKGDYTDVCIYKDVLEQELRDFYAWAKLN